MKKLLALMVAMIMVFGLASFAAAEVEFGGDARVRGTMKKNADYDADDDTGNMRWYDSRIRLRVKGTNDDGAGADMQWTTHEPAGGWDGNNIAVRRPGYDADDYAYVFFPVADGWTVSGGFMPANWGHKFWAWGSAQSRLKLVGKLDVATVGIFTQKANETYDAVDASGSLIGDYDVNAVFAISKLGEFKVGGMLVMAKDNTAVGDPSGTKIDVFGQGAVGDITVLFEVAQNSGDLYDGGSGDARSGILVAAAMDMDAFKVSGALATTKNGYTATKYFTPTVLIGTAQPSANFNLGECGHAMLGTCDTMALVLTADTKISDEMSVGGVFAYATIDGYSNATLEGSWMEIDARFKYSLGEQTSYYADLGYGMPTVEVGGVDQDADNITVISHGVNLKF